MSAGRTSRCSVLSLTLVVAITVLGAELLADRASTKDLGGAERYLTHVSTDKPIYRPGEKVYIRGVMLHANDHTPLADGGQAQAMIEIKGPKGDNVASGFAGASNVNDVFSTSHTAVALGIRGLRSLIAALPPASCGTSAGPKYSGQLGNGAL